MVENKVPKTIIGRPQTPRGGVFAVIVTFNPDKPVFERLLEAIVSQVAGVIVVDNGSTNMDIEAICQQYAHPAVSINVLPLRDNFGIAAAQNRGIERAITAGAAYILLLDHDSVPENTMVQSLLDAYCNLRKENIEVGAVGALTFDRRTGASSKVISSVNGRIKRLSASPEENSVEADFLISSGTLIPVTVFDRCGMMNESYFIDMVDTEWCFRVLAKGMRLFVIPRARLEHALGDEVIRVWLGQWREVCLHSPLRDYYMFRNVVRMLISVPMSRSWRIMYLRRLPQCAIFFGIVAPQRLRRLRLMLKGTIDGFRNKGGRLNM